MIFDPDDLSMCVSCGLCLSACPTFQVTHMEQHGPRGRISGMRFIQSGAVAETDPDYVDSMETCIQCRACEPACPSGVPFGRLMERAQASLAGRQNARGRRLRLLVLDVGLGMLRHRSAVRFVTVLLALAQVLRLDRLMPRKWRVARRIGLSDPLRPLRATRGDKAALLFRGCVMDAWFRTTHEATLRVLEAAGYAVRTEPSPPCCGALHLHTGRDADARRMAAEVVAAYRGTDGILVVNSAGCGAAMREYGHLLGTEEAHVFSARVRDFAEAVSPESLPPLRSLGGQTVVYQAACHLKNVQRVDGEVDRLLEAIPGLTVVRPADGELCCGAGGAYSLLQPEFGSQVRDRKVAALLETGATRVVSGNPGCMLHLGAAGMDMVHIAELVAEALPERGGSRWKSSGVPRARKAEEANEQLHRRR